MIENKIGLFFAGLYLIYCSVTKNHLNLLK
jgi:hypothetical protein